MAAKSAAPTTLDPLDFLALDTLLDEEEKAIRDTVRAFVRERIVPEVACPHATQTDASRATITSAMRPGDPPFMSGISSQAVILPQAILIHHAVRVRSSRFFASSRLSGKDRAEFTTKTRRR